jgi:hypothetical protein
MIVCGSGTMAASVIRPNWTRPLKDRIETSMQMSCACGPQNIICFSSEPAR